MPELPEVQTTVNGINQYCVGHVIQDIWTDYDSPYHRGKQNIKDPEYFEYFYSRLIGATITGASRRAKQILISVTTQDTQQINILVHMKMTGHFMYGTWQWNKRAKKWQPQEGFWNKTWALSKDDVYRTMPFSDPFNDYIHLMFGLITPKGDVAQLAFSDMRKFGTVTLIENDEQRIQLLGTLGPEPLAPGLTFEQFMSKLMMRPNKAVKTALLDQELIAGFGNIYTDEVLWATSVHPESLVGEIPEEVWRDIFAQGKKILRLALRHGGDSMGDYRNIKGQGGSFQNMHKVYQKEGQVCQLHNCVGVIEKSLIGQRIGRYCPEHQRLYD